MLTKTISYVDYNGESRKETHYFNISKAEFIKLDLSTAGGFEKMMQSLSEKKDVPGMLEVFDKLIRLSYGVKSADGRKLMKSDEIYKDFEQSEAYSELFVELCTDSEKALEFIRGVLSVDEDKFNAAVREKIASGEIDSDLVNISGPRPIN